MCPIKPVKHYFFSSASIAELLQFQTDTHTASVRLSSAAKLFRRIYAKINIFYMVLVQNIENGKLHRQVDSVDAGLNRDSQQVPRFFLSTVCIHDPPHETQVWN